MTKLNKILAAIIVVFGLWAGYGLHKESLLKARLDGNNEATKRQISTLQSEQKKKDAEYQVRIDSLQALKQKTVTVTQVVKALPTVLPLPEPVHEVTEKQAEAATKADPAAPSIQAGDVVIPKISVKPLFDAQVAAKECAVELAREVSRSQTLEAVSKVQDEQIQQRDNVIKGGTKWQRVKTAGKWSLLGAAGALVAEQILIHK